MALTPQVRSSQAATLALVEGTAPQVRAQQLGTMVVGNFPTEEIRSSSLGVMALVEEQAVVRSSQLSSMILALGRIQDPKIRAWTFTLDGHDFYVIRLGKDSTLLYDRLSEQWYVWGSDESEQWRAYNGQNWIGAFDRLARQYGSDVLIGDDGNGALYLLDPDRAVDDDALVGEEVPRTFLRRITGQMPTRSVDHIDDFGVQLIGSIGKIDNATLTAVTLYTSDDQGETYDDHGTITIANDDFDARVEWRSLGSYKAPGRLYRVDDVGALQRVDYLETLGDEDDDG